MIDRLADHLAHFLTLVPDADRDARWRRACADLDTARAALVAAGEPGAIVTDAEAAEIAARAAAATAGPWQSDVTQAANHNYVAGAGPWHLRSGDRRCVQADATFIAHSRTDVPRLLADRAARIAERTRLRRVEEEARLLLFHDRAADTREGLENCHEAQMLSDALDDLDAAEKGA